MRIVESARKHGVADEDMLHALRNPIGITPEDDDFTMYIGPSRDGQRLEVGVLFAETDDPIVIHAMPARPQYLP